MQNYISENIESMNKLKGLKINKIDNNQLSHLERRKK